MDKYYDRVRERVSDLYVQYSKTRQDYSVRLILIEEKLKELKNEIEVLSEDFTK